MAPERCKVPIYIVAVNRIYHFECLDIMADDFNQLSPLVLIFLHVPILLISKCMEMEQVVVVTLYLRTSFAQFGLTLSLIHIPASSIQ